MTQVVDQVAPIVPSVVSVMQPAVLAEPWIAVVIVVLLMLAAALMLAAQANMFGKRHWTWMTGFGIAFVLSSVSVAFGFLALCKMVMIPNEAYGLAAMYIAGQMVSVFVSAVITLPMWMIRQR